MTRIDACVHFFGTRYKMIWPGVLMEHIEPKITHVDPEVAMQCYEEFLKHSSAWLWEIYKQQRAEIQQLHEQLRNQTKSFCTHCGKLFPKGRDGIAAFQEHISECNSHPLHPMAKQLAEANKGRYRLTEECDEKEEEIQRIYAVQVEQKQQLTAAQTEIERLWALLRECEQLLVSHHNSKYARFDGECPVCSYHDSQRYPNNIFGRLQKAKEACGERWPWLITEAARAAGGGE